MNADSAAAAGQSFLPASLLCRSRKSHLESDARRRRCRTEENWPALEASSFSFESPKQILYLALWTQVLVHCLDEHIRGPRPRSRAVQAVVLERRLGSLHLLQSHSLFDR